MFKLLLFAVLVLVFLFAGFKVFTDIKTAETEKSYPPRGEFVDVEEVQMHYVKEGKGHPILFIHGSFGSTYDFTLSIFSEAKQKYEAIAIDRIGHGYSDRPRLKNVTIFDHARYLQKAIQAMGVDKPVIVGRSLGGAIAIAYALEFPDEIAGLVLLAAYVTPFTGPVHPMHTVAAVPILGEIYLQTLVRPIGSWLGKKIGLKTFYPNHVHPEYLETSTAMALRPSHFRSNAEDIRNLRPSLREINKRFSEIRVPTAVVTGDQDLIAPKEVHADKLMQGIPGAKLYLLKNVGHQLVFARPHEILSAIDFVLAQSVKNV